MITVIIGKNVEGVDLCFI